MLVVREVAVAALILTRVRSTTLIMHSQENSHFILITVLIGAPAITTFPVGSCGCQRYETKLDVLWC